VSDCGRNSFAVAVDIPKLCKGVENIPSKIGQEYRISFAQLLKAKNSS
jgi:hypothetical protein